MTKDTIVCMLIWALISAQLWIGFSPDKSMYDQINQATWCIIFSCASIGIERYNRVRCFSLSLLALFEFKDEMAGINISLYLNDLFFVCIVLILMEAFIVYNKKTHRWVI